MVKALARTGLPADYPALLQGIKERIRAAQVRATLSANAELIQLYWDIGRAIALRQECEGWGTAVIPRLARDLGNELPEVKGFSARNIGYMVRFYREYKDTRILQQAAAKTPSLEGPIRRRLISPPPVAKSAKTSPDPILQQLAAKIPWFHHVLLMEKVKDLPTRLWYMQQTLTHGWSRNILALQIDSDAHERAGKAVTNFPARLPPPQSDLAVQALKDPYVFDFLTLTEPFQERELETGLVAHLQRFLLELGQGFAFVGRQHRMEVGDEDFYIDLLFYHLRLRCFVVIDLKKGPFKAEYAGKMNFYCNLVDDRLRHAADQPTVGLILCQDKNRLVAEYALRGLAKAIGISEYRLTRSLPKSLRSSLPSIEEIEEELAAAAEAAAKAEGQTKAKAAAKATAARRRKGMRARRRGAAAGRQPGKRK